MARERSNFETYSMFYENILQQLHHLLYQKEQVWSEHWFYSSRTGQRGFSGWEVLAKWKWKPSCQAGNLLSWSWATPAQSPCTFMLSFRSCMRWKKVATKAIWLWCRLVVMAYRLVGLSSPIWDRVYEHMVIVFEKKGKGVLGLLFLCSIPEKSMK